MVDASLRIARTVRVMGNPGPGRETKFPSRRFAAALTRDGDNKMKKALVILASVVALGTAGMSAASARTVIIKKGGTSRHDAPSSWRQDHHHQARSPPRNVRRTALHPEPRSSRPGFFFAGCGQGRAARHSAHDRIPRRPPRLPARRRGLGPCAGAAPARPRRRHGAAVPRPALARSQSRRGGGKSRPRSPTRPMRCSATCRFCSFPPRSASSSMSPILRASGSAIAVAIVVSSLLAMAVTALVFERLGRLLHRTDDLPRADAP